MVAVEICRERNAMLNMDYTRPLQTNGTVGFAGVWYLILLHPLKPSPTLRLQLMEAVSTGTSEAALQLALTDLYAGLCELLQLEVPPGAEFAAAAQRKQHSYC